MQSVRTVQRKKQGDWGIFWNSPQSKKGQQKRSKRQRRKGYKPEMNPQVPVGALQHKNGEFYQVEFTDCPDGEMHRASL